MSAIAGAIIGGAASVAGSVINNQLAGQRTDIDRRQNYLYGEMQADAADRRTRALYNDLYSPGALLRQYKEAGLSPSLMFGGTPGQGGTTGAMGSNAGIQTPYMPLSMLEAAQIANITAQTKNVEADTEKKEAETSNVKIDTIRQEIAKYVEELQAGQYNTEWQIINSTWTEDGKQKSIFEAARDHFNYESFLEWCRSDKTDETIRKATTTEAGQRILRGIYVSASRFHNDIVTLSSNAVSAQFQQQIIQAMQSTNFAELNAHAAIGYLRQNIETAELTTTQKEAWNNLLEGLGKKGSTTRDIVVVLGMILNNAMSNWRLPNINIQGEKHQYKLSGGSWKEY